MNNDLQKTSKSDFVTLSENTLCVIKKLLLEGHYDFVNQQGGFVIEFGLKAAVCTKLQQTFYPYPPDTKYRTHDLNILVGKAGLTDALTRQKSENRNFFINWSLISKWSPEFRYLPIGSTKKEQAEEILNAIEHNKDGVYIWVRMNW